MAIDSPRRASVSQQHPVRSSDNVNYLTDAEIKQFLDDLDHNGDGFIDVKEVEQKLDQAHKELLVKPRAHHILERGHSHSDDAARHAFLQGMMGSDAQERIPRGEFEAIVRSWNIPSLQQAKQTEREQGQSYFKRLLSWRKARAYWAVHGPEMCFVGLVVSMQIAFGVWQLVKYQTTPQYRAAFGWGVVMAKTCAGALYPTFFFLILSMSRYFSTFLRRFYYLSRFFNSDLSQEFHIRISCVAILLATLHALGHLTGSFVHGSDPDNEAQVANVLGPDAVPRPYIDYVASVPGFTGITSLGLMYILSLLSIPPVRRWSYELFQLGHVLMFPIIGLMMAHGTAHLLQWPMFGYFLAFPALLVVVERLVRVSVGFHPITATLKILDDETVEISTVIPSERLWKYRAGQYIFLQVPKISYFQWHPFTVSFCRGKKMMVHIKTDGNWTGKLRELGNQSAETEIKVGINGPFGAPAQRFYDFNHSVIIGAGIGVTPFSGILADLQQQDDMDHGGPEQARLASAEGEKAKKQSQELTEGNADNKNPSQGDGPLGAATPFSAPQEDSANGGERTAVVDKELSFCHDYRRVDFHWIVRDRNYLLWISNLLNEVSRSQAWHRQHEAQPHLDIRLDTHVTAKQKNLVTHVYRWLLEMHRTDEHPASPLTGLLNPTHFGRPDFDVILDEHYEEMRSFWANRRQVRRRSSSSSGSSSSSSEGDDEELKVGVFYCGSPVVGEILADKCRELTTRGRHDGTRIMPLNVR